MTPANDRQQHTNIWAWAHTQSIKEKGPVGDKGVKKSVCNLDTSLFTLYNTSRIDE